MVAKNENYCGLVGIEFVEYSAPGAPWLNKLFTAFGFSKLKKHAQKDIVYYNQNDIHFIINNEPGSFAVQFAAQHGPSISAMGWRVENAKKAYETAIARGAKAAELVDYQNPKTHEKRLAIKGIGDSLIYFVDDFENGVCYENMGLVALDKPEMVESMGFTVIDHLTNNVYKGTMAAWADFYKNIFGFTEVRYFDIRGVKTGLTSYALKSPDGSFCIPINEGTEATSQINEYLNEYKGPGVQHLAFLTNDIVKSLNALSGSGIETLDIDDEYYQEVFQRITQVTEDKKELQRLGVLVDGDKDGYLLQIFTKNLIGPIFIEIIQRKNHFAFGEGNFGALFRSIERDQQKRGVL